MINLNSILATFPEWGQKVPPLSLFGGEKRHHSVKKLSMLMSGKKISVKNPAFPGNLHFANKMTFVYITESHIKYRKMKTIYGAAGFEILSKNIDKINYNKAAANITHTALRVLSLTKRR